jgi:alanyl-tRNA synthetase
MNEMTERLYYRDSFLYEFSAEVEGVLAPTAGESRTAILLNRTAFYPTSGGQVFDTGRLIVSGDEFRVVEVSETEEGDVLHHVEGMTRGLQKGTSVQGAIDTVRRRDHMQQHSGQHLLSAVFMNLFQMPTLSFHMGAESSSIDLDAKALSPSQVEEAEKLANQLIAEDRLVRVRFVTQEEARTLGLRKLPPADKDELRLIEIEGLDLSACGGTHVRATGQVGSILLRKVEKVRQGMKVEFVCGERARATARRDYQALTEAAGLYSSHLWDVPQQIRKSQDDARTTRKVGEQVLEELAVLQAEKILASTPLTGALKLVVRLYPDRDLTFVKLLAQKLTRQQEAVIALLGTTLATPTLIFARSGSLSHDMGQLMKDVLAKLGGRGGGSKDLAQGGPADVTGLDAALAELAARLRTSS